MTPQEEVDAVDPCMVPEFYEHQIGYYTSKLVVTGVPEVKFYKDWETAEGDQPQVLQVHREKIKPVPRYETRLRWIDPLDQRK